jgi:hypothetical protein
MCQDPLTCSHAVVEALHGIAWKFCRVSFTRLHRLAATARVHMNVDEKMGGQCHGETAIPTSIEMY